MSRPLPADARRLQLLLFTLGALSGCSQGGGAAPPPPPTPSMLPEMEFPPCPSGNFDSTVEVATELANKGRWDGAKELDCPSRYSGSIGDGSGPDYLEVSLRLDLTEAARAAGQADACIYGWFEPCPGGRPLGLTAGTPVAAPLSPERAAAWAGPLEADDRARLAAGFARLSPAVQQELRAAWRRDAQAEHASIGAFAALSQQLLALGAPAALLLAAHEAAADEIRHAQGCFDLLDAFCDAVGPAPVGLPQPSAPCWEQVAVEALIEGVWGESLAALCAARAARASTHAPIRALWGRIAEDEARHAGFALRLLVHALELQPALQPLLQRRFDDLVAGIEALPATPDGLSERNRDTLARWGRLGSAARAEARADTIALVRGLLEPLWNGQVLGA